MHWILPCFLCLSMQDSKSFTGLQHLPMKSIVYWVDISLRHTFPYIYHYSRWAILKYHHLDLGAYQKSSQLKFGLQQPTSSTSGPPTVLLLAAESIAGATGASSGPASSPEVELLVLPIASGGESRVIESWTDTGSTDGGKCEGLAESLISVKRGWLKAAGCAVAIVGNETSDFV